MNTIRSAVSAVANIGGFPAGRHTLVSRFMKSVFNERPSLPRYCSTWDPKIVLDFIKTLGPNKKLTNLQLTKKLVILLLLVSGERGHLLHLLDTRNMDLKPARVTFSIGDLLKTTKPNFHKSEVTFKAYAPDRRICPYTALMAYLERTSNYRGDTTQLFITTTKPFRPASRDSIRRWAKNIMQDAGINTNLFKPHSTRSAVSSKMA